MGGRGEDRGKTLLVPALIKGTIVKYKVAFRITNI